MEEHEIVLKVKRVIPVLARWKRRRFQVYAQDANGDYYGFLRYKVNFHDGDIIKVRYNTKKFSDGYRCWNFKNIVSIHKLVQKWQL